MEARGGGDAARPSRKSRSRPRSLQNISASGVAGALPSCRAGARLREVRRAFSVFHDGRPGEGDSGRPGRSRVRSPMDRVICGDVGFGKTEVALRAAAAVVLSGKQVAIAVPTTVLARQHVATFRKRFGPFGIEVGNLSRATSAAETRETKEGLRRGKLKVVVGTQALASKDVKFADLGLVIIDEEQHFGAAEKAKLSASRKASMRFG